ncbi:MAG: pyrroline-5-carboxylate reductase [Patescibacteria group bacterium]
MNIGIIGCGHMGSAIANALLNKKVGKIFASSKTFSRTAPNAATKNFKWVVDNVDIVDSCELICLAVRPGDIQEILTSIKKNLKNQILVSIAAGVSLKKLTAWSGGYKKIVRVMPNLPVQVGEGMSVWKSTPGISAADKKIVLNFLNSFGKSLEVSEEKLIDIATAVSGGGPAYTAAFLECMADACEKIGFTKDAAKELALQTVIGSANYIQKTGAEFSLLKKLVQTKGGTTEAGFKVLKKKQWQKTLKNAFFAGYKRARTIAK